jgi:hypothetical protein
MWLAEQLLDNGESTLEKSSFFWKYTCILLLALLEVAISVLRLA